MAQGGAAKPAITVVVADDHAIVRQGIAALLREEPDIAVVGEAADGKAAVELAQRIQPRVVLMDISMPRLNGITATAQIRRTLPRVAVVILSVHADHAYVAQALASGARGYLLKQSAGADLAQAIRVVDRGEVFLSPEISSIVVQDYTQGRSAAVYTDADLTPREVEVLQLIAEGYGNKEIARLLKVSVKTVETHRSRLMNKLDIHETAGLVRYAIRKRIVQP